MKRESECICAQFPGLGYENLQGRQIPKVENSGGVSEVRKILDAISMGPP
jgi:hypothetical protein